MTSVEVWSQAPELRPGDPSGGSLRWVPWALALTALGAVVDVLVGPDGGPAWIVLSAAAVCAAALAVNRPGGPLTGPVARGALSVLAVVSVVVLVPTVGVTAAGWVALGTALARVADPPVPLRAFRLEAQGRVALGSNSLAVVAMILGGSWLGLALLSLAVVAGWAVRGRPATVDAVDARARRALRLVADGVVAIVLAVLGLVVVVLPWGVWWLSRWDPTWSPRGEGSRWTSRGRAEADPRRPWDPDVAVGRRAVGRRLHHLGVLAVWVVVAAVAVGGWMYVGSLGDDPAPPAAMAGAEWWPELHEAISAVHENLVLNTMVTTRLPDVESPHLNVHDGARATWAPPPGRCEPLSVWMYGGSAMFGEGQRDDGTIASHLAKVAAADGIPLRVENLGVPGDTLFIESRRLELRLASSEERPDLVTFYDGFNELQVRNVLNASGLADRGPGEGWIDATLYRTLFSVVDPVRDLRNRWLLDDSVRIGSEPAPRRLPPAEVGRRALGQYELGLEFSRRIAQGYDLDAVWFYQPTALSRKVVQGDLGRDPQLEVPEEVFRSSLPPGIVDLSGALDGVDGPVFYDPVHHNERGARAVAEAMFADLEPRLRQLCAAEEARACC